MHLDSIGKEDIELDYFNKKDLDKLKEQLDECDITFFEYYMYYCMRQRKELLNQLENLNELLEERLH